MSNNYGANNLSGGENGALTFEQIGIDIFRKDHSFFPGGSPFAEYRAVKKASDPAPGVNVTEIIMPEFREPHWIGVTNLNADGETLSVQAHSLTGDHLCIGGTIIASNHATYIEVSPGDTVYGRFKIVYILKTSGAPFVDYYKLIRGV